MRATAEQAAAVDLFLSGQSFKVLAVAGAGKTSTLEMMAKADPFQKGRLLAFNKSIITEAQRRMPSNLKCQTAHSLAYGGTPAAFRERLDMSQRMRSRELAAQLGVTSIRVANRVNGKTETKTLEPWFLAGLVMAAVETFCQSADPVPSARHFDYVDGIDHPEPDGTRTWHNNHLLRQELLPHLIDAWLDLSSPHGRLPYRHSHYLKQYELRGPRLRSDYIMVDEAQDLSPVLMSIVEQQTDCQVILVGDSYQAVNQWTGAVDALKNTAIDLSTPLTKSWRFGPQIADLANEILDSLDADLRVVGNEQVSSAVRPLPVADCHLARTNAGAVRRVLTELKDGGKPHLVGGGKPVSTFAQAAIDLQTGKKTSHSELACFANWDEVREYVALDQQGNELRLMVNLIDEFGPSAVLKAVDRMPAEDSSSLVCSTAHKVKGREWDTVTLDEDFPTGYRHPDHEELQLLYVAVTRARYAVDITRVGYLNPVDA